MASLRKESAEFWLARGRRRNGTSFEFSTGIPQEPPPGTPKEAYATRKAILKAAAKEEADDMEARERGEMKEEEFASRQKFRIRKFLGQTSTARIPAFLVAWVWEHVIRNRVSHGIARQLCELIHGLVKHIGDLQEETIHELLPEHFHAYSLHLRQQNYAPNTVNNSIIYLRSLGKEIKAITGVDVAKDLEQETSDTAERMPFPKEEIDLLFKTIPGVMLQLAREWTTFLLILLYTAMRPCDAAKVKRSDIDLINGTMRVKPTKTINFNKKLPRKPIHEVLLAYLRGMLTELELGPDDYLCPNLAHKTEANLAVEFNKLPAAAQIDQMTKLGEHRRRKFSQKTLYSFRHTANVWLDAAGATDAEQKIELADSTQKALEAYQHKNDPRVLAVRRKKINDMPHVTVAWCSKKTKS